MPTFAPIPTDEINLDEFSLPPSTSKVDWEAIGAYARKLAEKKARRERQVINSNAKLALRIFEVEKEACMGFPPSREMLARLVRSTQLRANGALRIVSI